MIQLTLTEEQAHIVATACEFYARVCIGQFDRIIDHTLIPGETNIPDLCARRDKAQEYLLLARKELIPELHGIGHSYGIGKFKHADQAYDVYQALRVLFGDKRKPFSYYEIPKAERID